MAASIIAGVCEDRQDYDYELIRPSKAEKTPKLCIPAGIRSKNPPSSPANVAPPSHNVRRVTSVPSLGAPTAAILRLDGGARGQQHLDHLQVAFPSRICQRPVASVRKARLQMATGRAKSQELLRRISEDFGSKIGSSVRHFQLRHVIICITTNQNIIRLTMSHLDWEVSIWNHVKFTASDS